MYVVGIGYKMSKIMQFENYKSSKLCVLLNWTWWQPVLQEKMFEKSFKNIYMTHCVVCALKCVQKNALYLKNHFC